MFSWYCFLPIKNENFLLLGGIYYFFPNHFFRFYRIFYPQKKAQKIESYYTFFEKEFIIFFEKIQTKYILINKTHKINKF